MFLLVYYFWSLHNVHTAIYTHNVWNCNNKEKRWLLLHWNCDKLICIVLLIFLYNYVSYLCYISWTGLWVTPRWALNNTCKTVTQSTGKILQPCDCALIGSCVTRRKSVRQSASGWAGPGPCELLRRGTRCYCSTTVPLPWLLGSICSQLGSHKSKTDGARLTEMTHCLKILSRVFFQSIYDFKL